MDAVINSLEQHWRSYTAAFDATSEDERERLLEQCVSEEVIFTNPGGEGKSRAGLSAHIGNFQKSMPGAHFSTEKIFVHHGELLAIWTLYKQDGGKVATGYNFVRPDEDGRFEYMAGFF
jgi:hypothetical protein